MPPPEHLCCASRTRSTAYSSAVDIRQLPCCQREGRLRDHVRWFIKWMGIGSATDTRQCITNSHRSGQSVCIDERDVGNLLDYRKAAMSWVTRSLLLSV